jgi:hypothetical protein
MEALLSRYFFIIWEYFLQGRREGVKGVTVSRGLDLKMEPGNHENQRKVE